MTAAARLKLTFVDGVVVFLPEHANRIAGTIDDQGEELQKIPTEDAHVERFRIGETRELAFENDFSSCLLGKADFRLDQNRVHAASHAAQLLGVANELEGKRFENVSAKYGTVGTGVDQKWNLEPCSVILQDFALNDGTNDAVIAKMPASANEHRCDPFVPEECSV